MKYAIVAGLAATAAANPLTTVSVNWETWSTTTTKPADPTTWTSWDPKPTTSTTWTTWDPKPTTWTSWDPKGKTSSTTWTSWNPPKGSSTWSNWNTWSTTTTTPVKPTSCSYVTTVPTTYCVPGSSDKCWGDVATTTMYADTCTWAPWPTTTQTGKPCYTTTYATSTCAPNNGDWCYPYTTTSTLYADVCTWGTWTTPTPVVNTQTYTWNTWATPVVNTQTYTWNSWASTKTVQATVTNTQTTWATWSPVVVTSVVTPGWSSSGWFGPAWATPSASQCVNNVVTSYGVPVWTPVPAATTWSTWASPVAVTKTATSTWSAWTGTSTGNAVIAPNGKKWAMTYAIYDSSSNCKTQEVIYADIANLASLGFTSVRVYSTDCQTLEYVGGACRQYGLKIILGVYIDVTGVSSAQGQISDIVAWAQWDIVELIVIGNEAVFQGYCSADELVTLVSSSKASFAAAGYTGPCTLTEPLEQWQQYGASQFCEVVDVVAANLYAFFNSDCPASNAGTFIASEVSILETICVSTKPAYVMECGWPSAGQCNGAACPGVQEQVTAITAIEEVVGSQIVWFSYENEGWKSPGQFGVEQYWGAASVFSSGWSPAPVAASSTTTWNTWATPAATTTWSTYASPAATKWAAY